MPRGDKSFYSVKQKRQAEHIAQAEKKQGKSQQSAEKIAWATVNKLPAALQKKRNKPCNPAHGHHLRSRQIF